MDRLVENFRKLARKALDDLLSYALTDRYTVVSCNVVDQTVDVRSQSITVPDLTGVKMRAPGLVLDVRPGTQVSVGYDSDGTPYAVIGTSGGLSPIVPNSGSGVKNQIDAGYILIVQAPATPFTVLATYFPAGVAGKLAADTAHAAAPGSILLHLDGARMMPDPWTVP